MLPELSHPKFTDTIPSTKKEIRYRPFLMKEQKVLLLAAESKDPKEIEMATREVLKACIENEINLDKLTTYDIEYLFLRLRSKSVGEVVTLTFFHSGGKNRKGEECDARTDVDVMLDDVNIVNDPSHKNVLVLDDTITVNMKYPSFEEMSKLISFDANALNDDSINIIAGCIDTIFKGEEPFSSSDYTVEDKVKFLEGTSEIQFKMFTNFFETMPQLKHKVTYKCSKCGQEDQYELEGLSDFF
jgi:hypothetical protein